MTNNQVIETFVKQTKPKAKSSTGALYFEDGTIYSYGPHFKIAILKGFNKAVITTRRYSVTTTRQTNAVRVALYRAGYQLTEKEL